jgi:hypothetical protein
MEKEPTLISMELCMKECGKMICNMEKDLKLGLTIQSMRETINTEESTEKDFITGVTVPCMMEIGLKTKFLDT